MNIYAELTEKFNTGRPRAVLAGGQAVVLYRLAVMSKDGNWIIREDDETTEHILSVLESYGAHYRFGAPLDIRWLKAGTDKLSGSTAMRTFMYNETIETAPRAFLANMNQVFLPIICLSPLSAYTNMTYA